MIQTFIKFLEMKGSPLKYRESVKLQWIDPFL